jgi:hypothetical protein
MSNSALDKLSQKTSISENQSRNDAFYQQRRKVKGRKILAVQRPRHLSEVLAATLEGLRMESQESRAVANYRVNQHTKDPHVRRKEWKKKENRSHA